MAKKKKHRPNNQLTSGDSVIARSKKRSLPATPFGGQLPRNTIPDRIIVVCFYAIVAALPLFFVYPTFDIFELAKLTLLRLLTLTLIGAWAAKCYRERRISVARTPLDIFIVVYLAAYILATAFSQNPVLSLLGEYGRFEGLLTIINYTAIFCLAGSLIRNNSAAPDTRTFIRSLILTAIGAADIISVYGVLQRFGIDFFTWSSAGTDLTRAFSTMGNPIYIAAYLTIVGSIALSLFLVETSLKTRLYLGSSIVVITLTLVFTFSRAGWAGFLFSLLVLTSLLIIMRNRKSGDSVISRSYPKSRDSVIARSERMRATKQPPKNRLVPTIILVSVAAIVIVLAVALSASYGSAPTKSTISRALSAFDLKSAGAVERISLWKSSVEMIKDRPFLGWGPDTFGTYFTKYRRQDLVDFEYNVAKLATPRYQNRPHSDILQQGISAGLLGMIAYLSFVIAYFLFALRRLIRISKSRVLPSLRGSASGISGDSVIASSGQQTGAKQPPSTLNAAFDRALLIGIIAGLAGYFLQIQFSFSTIAVAPQVWLLMGLTFVIGAGAKGEELRAKSKEQIMKNGNNIVRVSEANRELDLSLIPDSLLMISTAVVILVCVLGAVFSVRPFIADYYFDQGVYALETTDAYLAETSFDRALSLNPYEAEYANYAASSFTDAAKASGNAGNAESLLLTAIDYEDAAIAINPDMPGYRYNLGNALYYYASLPALDKQESTRRYKAAAKEFEIAVSGDPKNTDVHLNLASAYLRLGRKDAAIAQIKLALTINPGRTQAKTWLETLEKETQ